MIFLKAIPADAADASLKKYRGQALASRAFDYLQLIQTYQLTYIGPKQLMVCLWYWKQLLILS